MRCKCIIAPGQKIRWDNQKLFIAVRWRSTGGLRYPSTDFTPGGWQRNGTEKGLFLSCFFFFLPACVRLWLTDQLTTIWWVFNWKIYCMCTGCVCIRGWTSQWLRIFQELFFSFLFRLLRTQGRVGNLTKYLLHYSFIFVISQQW